MKRYFYLFSLILIIGAFFALPETAAAAFRITAPAILPAPQAGNLLPAGTQGQPYSFQFQASETATWQSRVWNYGEMFPLTTPETACSALGKLPSEIGLTLSSSGLLSGTSTLSGIFGFRVQATKNQYANDARNFCLTINAPATPIPPPPGGGDGTIPGPVGGSGASMTRACQGQPLSIDNPNFYQGKNTTGNVETAAYDGLVPCGKCVVVNGTKTGNTISGTGTYVSCQFCHFFVMFGGIINFLIWKIAIPAAVLLLVIGGAMFVFAAGQPGLIKKGTDIMTSVVIGLVIMFAAWLVVNTIFAFLGVAGWTGLQQGWFQINCPIKI